MPGGRPSTYSVELSAAICARVAGGETVSEVCRDEAMPARSTVYLWAVDHTEFSDALARAREAQAEHFADEIHEIADDGSNDWMDRRLDNGRVVRSLDHEHVSRSKLRIETRRWLMGKWAPKRYGDQVAVTGAGGGPIQTEDVTPLDRARTIAFALAKAAQAVPAPGKE